VEDGRDTVAVEEEILIAADLHFCVASPQRLEGLVQYLDSGHGGV